MSGDSAAISSCGAALQEYAFVAHLQDKIPHVLGRRKLSSSPLFFYAFTYRAAARIRIREMLLALNSAWIKLASGLVASGLAGASLEELRK